MSVLPFLFAVLKVVAIIIVFVGCGLLIDRRTRRRRGSGS